MHEYQLLIEGYPLPVTGTDIDTTKFVYTKDLYQEVRIIHIILFIKYLLHLFYSHDKKPLRKRTEKIN